MRSSTVQYRSCSFYVFGRKSILCCWLVYSAFALFVPRNQTNRCAPTEMQHFKWTVRVLCEQAANVSGLRATNPGLICLIQYIELTFSPVLFLHLLLVWCLFFFFFLTHSLYLSTNEEYRSSCLIISPFLLTVEKPHEMWKSAECIAWGMVKGTQEYYGVSNCNICNS